MKQQKIENTAFVEGPGDGTAFTDATDVKTDYIDALIPKCPSCRKRMQPIDQRDRRIPGGREYCVQWECGPCEVVEEVVQQMQRVLHPEETWAPDYVWRESAAKIKKQKEKDALSETINAYGESA